MMIFLYPKSLGKLVSMYKSSLESHQISVINYHYQKQFLGLFGRWEVGFKLS